MELTLSKNNRNGGKLSRRSKLPVKRTINLAAVAEEKPNVPAAVLALVLILVGAAAISKFAVMDRLNAMQEAENEVVALQRQLDELYDLVGQYDELEEDYAHYSFAGMTEYEMNLTDRAEIINMIQRVLRPEDSAGSWSVSGNHMTIDVTGSSLQQINELAKRMESDEIVDFCTVTNAVMTASDGTVSNLLGPTSAQAVYSTPDREEPAEGGESPEGGEPAEGEESPEGGEPAEEALAEDEEVVVPLVKQSVKAVIVAYLHNPTEDESQ